MIEYSNGKKKFISKNEAKESKKEEKEVQIFSRKERFQNKKNNRN